MRALLLCGIAIRLSGCAVADSGGDRKDVRHDVPLEVIRAIPSRLQGLKPGMTPTTVLQTLGLGAYSVISLQSGPQERLGYEPLLGHDCFLFLYYDARHEPPSFIEARLSGSGWAEALKLEPNKSPEATPGKRPPAAPSPSSGAPQL